jgi:anti-sigma factor RsiW
MNCSIAQQSWHERRDGELPVERQAALELHLRSCAACRDYCRQMEALDGALDFLRVASSQAGGTAAEAAPAQAGRKSVTRSHSWTWRRAWRKGRVAAVIALFLGAGSYLTDSPDSPDGPAPRPTTVTQPVPDSVAENVAEVELVGESAAKYIAVAQQSSQPNVHVFVLYRTSAGPAGLN